jgi:tetratricopeptide (TPR) repeat protein
MLKILYFILIGLFFVGCSTTQQTNDILVDDNNTVEKTPLETTTPPTNQSNEIDAGKQAFEAENYKTAVDNYSQWIIKYPNDALALLERGRAKRQMKQFHEALADFEKASAADPKDLTPKVYQANMLITLNRLEEARKILDSVTGNSAFSKLGNYEKFMAFYMDGQLCNQQENFTKAVASLDEAIKIFDLYPHIFRNYKSPAIDRFAIYQKSVAYFGLHDYKKAATEIEKYIQVSQAKGMEVVSQDYKSLALAYYLSNNLAKCRSVLPNVSQADRQDLAKRLEDNLFVK